MEFRMTLTDNKDVPIELGICDLPSGVSITMLLSKEQAELLQRKLSNALSIAYGSNL